MKAKLNKVNNDPAIVSSSGLSFSIVRVLETAQEKPLAPRVRSGGSKEPPLKIINGGLKIKR